MSETTTADNPTTQRKMIVKPTPFSFARRIPLVSPNVKLNHTLNSTPSTSNTPRTIIYNKIRPIALRKAQTLVTEKDSDNQNIESNEPRVYSKFAAPAMVVVDRDASGKTKKIIVPQVTSASGQITRMPIMIKRPVTEVRPKKLPECEKKQPTRPKSPFDRPKSLDFNVHIAAESLNLNPKLAITSEPLLLHYQEIMSTYKRQVRELQNEIKNYRRREDQLKKKAKGPQMVCLCKKPFLTSSGNVKRKIAKQLKEAVDVLLGSECGAEDKKAALIKAFPEAFEQGSSQAKLDTQQTWMFERKFKLNNGIMDRYRRYLNQYNANPFASRRQINNHRAELERTNPSLLNFQPGDDSSPPNSDEEMDDDGYVPNITRVTVNNNRRPNTTTGVTTVLRGELYTSNTTAAAQYGQQLIQQEQYIRRLQTAQSYNAARQAQNQPNPNPQEQQYGSLPRQQPTQSTVPSAFQPANSTYSNYTSLYNGHY